MAAILEEADFDQVRELLGVDAGELPNDTIAGFAYLEAAELEVKRRVSEWEALLATDDGLVALKTATANLTAARLVTRQENRQRSGDRIGPLALGQINWSTLRAHLESEAAEMIRSLVTVADDVLPVTIFTVDGVSRQRRERVRAGEWCP